MYREDGTEFSPYSSAKIRMGYVCLVPRFSALTQPGDDASKFGHSVKMLNGYCSLSVIVLVVDESHLLTYTVVVFRNSSHINLGLLSF